MKILMRGNSTDENYDADISFVYVDLTAKLARLALKRIAEFKRLKAKDSSALETYYWNHDALYLRYDKVSEKEAEAVNTDLVVDAATEISFDDGENTECDQMTVGEGHISFTAIPKHTGIYIVSERIPLSTLREAARPTKKKSSKKAA